MNHIVNAKKKISGAIAEPPRLWRSVTSPCEKIEYAPSKTLINGFSQEVVIVVVTWVGLAYRVEGLDQMGLIWAYNYSCYPTKPTS